MIFSDYTDEQIRQVLVDAQAEVDKRVAVGEAKKALEESAAIFMRNVEKVASLTGDPSHVVYARHMPDEVVTWISLGGSVSPNPTVWRMGTSYRQGDLVYFNDAVYQSLQNENTFSPVAYPQGWKAQK